MGVDNMEEVLKAVFGYFQNDDGKNSKGEWLDPDDHRTYSEILDVSSENIGEHLVPVKQPRLNDDVMPLVAFYTSNFPIYKPVPMFKTLLLDFDIYTKDNLFVENVKIAKRHFQLLEGYIISIPDVAYGGVWRHVTEFQVPMKNANYFCYTQRFEVPIQRVNRITKLKK